MYAHTHVRNSSQIHIMVFSPVIQNLCTVVRFSSREEDWIVGSALGKETEALVEISLCYYN